MDDNEKLLEAARMIRDHCRQTERNEPCPLAYGGVCDGVSNCGCSRPFPGECVPGDDWDIPDTRKWTPADKALAAGLKANGYTSITRVCGSGHVIASLGESPDSLDLGEDLFKGLAKNECVYLYDIIADGESQ